MLGVFVCLLRPRYPTQWFRSSMAMNSTLGGALVGASAAGAGMAVSASAATRRRVGERIMEGNLVWPEARWSRRRKLFVCLQAIGTGWASRPIQPFAARWVPGALAQLSRTVRQRGGGCNDVMLKTVPQGCDLGSQALSGNPLPRCPASLQ